MLLKILLAHVEYKMLLANLSLQIFKLLRQLDYAMTPKRVVNGPVSLNWAVETNLDAIERE